MAAEAEIVEAAPAKLNLHLHVTGRRADGYHLLDSLVVFAGIGDVIRILPAAQLGLTGIGPFAATLPPAEENLVMKAARMLAAKFGIKAGAQLTLEKNLPPASGIGGGSADAAAAIRALCRLWQISSSRPELAEIALGLGADVPVCLAGRAAIMRGIGETLSPPPPLPSAHVLLINPGQAVSTPAVFKARRGDFSKPAAFPASMPDAGALAAALKALGNDLQAPAIELAPRIGDVLEAIGRTPGVLLARMSGSGGTCFGLFAQPSAAADAAQALAEAHPNWWVRAAPLLPSDAAHPGLPSADG